MPNIRFESSAKVSAIRRACLSWFSQSGRDFPWRRTRDPYQIFLAEVLLRRTQANRVVGPYQNLLLHYPTLVELAEADLLKLKSLFDPLGLSSRAKLLKSAAALLVKEFDGAFPSSLDELARLPGLGVYGSNAVYCMAFGGRVPMVDESTGRLLRRLFGLRSRRPAYSDTKLLELATRILPVRSAREFNLGALDIAAANCHPRDPDCFTCPLAKCCIVGHRMFAARDRRRPGRRVLGRS